MIRKARIYEIPKIHKFLEDRHKHGILPRSLPYLYNNLRDYFVCMRLSGRVLGLAALHITWEDIGEIRSLAVIKEHQGQGIGTNLMDHCLEEARLLELKRVFLLCMIPDYFKRFGFKEINRNDLHPTVWFDCYGCWKYGKCDEIPMIREL